MKILFVHNFYRHEGGEESVLNLERKLLVENGHEVDVFSVRSSDVSDGNLWKKARAFASVPYARAEGKRLARVISKNFFDVVHIHNLSPFLGAAALQAVPPEIPCVQTLHNFRAFCINGLFLREGKICERCAPGTFLPGLIHRCHQASAASSAALTLSRWVSQISGAWERPDLYLCPSGFLMKKYVENGYPAEKMRWVPNGCEDTAERSRAEGGALFLGRFSEEKGLTWLLQAQRKNNLPLSLAGAGPMEEVLRHEATVSPELRILGWQDAQGMHESLLKAGYLVIPSICYENQPTVCLLAMARGLPLIVSKLGGLPELVEDGVNGFVVEPGDVDALALAMARMQSLSLAERQRMGNESRKKYDAHFTAEAHLRTLLDAYRGHGYRQGKA